MVLRGPHPVAARYLAWLAEHTGYGLSGLESQVAAHAAPTVSQETGKTAEDETAGTEAAEEAQESAGVA